MIIGNIAKTSLRAAIHVLACVATVTHAQQQPGQPPGAYPNKPIRFIISFVPGGAADAFGRILGQKLKGFEAGTWFGVQVPAGTPRSIIATLRTEITKILRQPETAERFASQGYELVASTPEEFTAFVRAEIAKWAEAVKKSGARMD